MREFKSIELNPLAVIKTPGEKSERFCGMIALIFGMYNCVL